VTPEEVIAQGKALLDSGNPFEAHEVFEDEWKAVRGTSRDAERDFWRGLAQAAVAAEHARRGNEVGHQRLRERAALTLAPHAGTTLYGVDVDALVGRLRSGTISLGSP
jgi:predicted metal-dependent hydrolase